MTSQTWLTTKEVDRTIWWHQVAIVIPNKIKTNTGFVWLAPDAGHNDEDSMPTAKTLSLQLATLISNNLKCIGTVVFQLPNQPLSFTDDPSHRNRT